MAKYFKREELMCKCGCGGYYFDPQFLNLLDELREKCGFALIVNSGYRCPEWNKKIGGSPNSAHLKGLAVDLKVEGNYERMQIIKNWCLIIEKYKVPARMELGYDYIHIDVDRTKPNNLFWFNKKNFQKNLCIMNKKI